MVKCINCQNLLQGHMILRPVNGEIKASSMLSKQEVISMLDNSRIVDNDFECAEQDGTTVLPDEDIECKMFKKLK
jgi:hypothetical protein